MTKNILNIILILLIPFSSFAQLEVFDSEIEYIDDIAMYKNQKFTGTVYSDDINIVPNSCECTLKAHYKNGKRDGKYTTWNNDGTLQIEATYIKGKLNGDKKYYTNNKLVKNESYNNDKLLKKINFSNGKIEKVTIYQSDTERIEKIINNKIVTENIYKNNILIETNKYKNDILLKKELFDKPNNKKVIVYDDSGTKLSEYYYINNELISGGKLVNGKREGEWTIYSDDMLVKKLITYKNGNPVKTTIIDARKYIKNNKPNENSMIIRYANILNNKHEYYLIKFIEQQYYKDLKQNIAQLITHRTQVINDYKKYGEQEIDFLLTFKWLNNNELSIIRSDFDGKVFEKYIVTVPKIFEKIELLNAKKLNTHQTIPLNKIFSKYFPIHFYISGVRKQTETEVNYINVDKGKYDGVIKKIYFVYDQETKSIMSEVKPIKIYKNKSVCKVYSYQEWLKKYMKKHQNILIIEK